MGFSHCRTWYGNTDTVPWNGTGGRTCERTGQGSPCSSPAHGHWPGPAGEEQGATGGSLCCWWKRQGWGSIMPLARTPGIPPVGWGKKEPVRELKRGTELCPHSPRPARLQGCRAACTGHLGAGRLWALLQTAMATSVLSTGTLCALRNALRPPATPTPHLRGLLVVLPLWLQQRLNQRLLNSLLGHLLRLGVKQGVSPTHTIPPCSTHPPCPCQTGVTWQRPATHPGC